MFLTTGAWAKTEPTPTSESLNQEQINALTNRIASRVAQLKLVERRGIIGKVTEVSSTNITITDAKGDTRFVDVDEFTKFSSPSSKPSFGISDITKGSTIGILGLYNKESRRILARFIDVVHLPEIIHGYISSVDLKNFVLTVASENATAQDTDVETTTIILSYEDTQRLARSGFSKLTEGENVVVIGFYDIKNNQRLIASKIIAFPNIPRNPKIKTPVKSSPSPTVTLPTPTTNSKKTSSY